MGNAWTASHYSQAQSDQTQDTEHNLSLKMHFHCQFPGEPGKENDSVLVSLFLPLNCCRASVCLCGCHLSPREELPLSHLHDGFS